MSTIREKLAPTWWERKQEGDAFLLAPLSQYDAIDLGREVSMRKGRIFITGEGVRIAGTAVLDWRGVRNKAGEDVRFTRDEYDRLDIPTLTAIASEVFKRSFLSEIERKNSLSPSTSG